MADTISSGLTTFVRGLGIRQLRLACGSILFTYLVSHFLNHALGNISMEALDTGLYYHMLFWQSLPVMMLFYGAALVHAGLGVFAFYERRQFRWRTIEPLQLVLGLSIPALIVGHFVGVRMGQAIFGHEKLYPQTLYAYWVAWPDRKWLMFAVLVISWVHGCIGLYFWLRMKALYRIAAPYLLAAAVLLPTLALLGLYQGGRSVVAEADEREWQAKYLSRQQVGTAADQAVLDQITYGFLVFYLGLLGVTLAGRGLRALMERRSGIIRLSYGNGKTIRVPKGLSVLEASLRNNVPHASVCGGRARCSTCRIRIIGDYAMLPKASGREAFVLQRVGAGDDPSIRLACQLRPDTDLSFFQIFTPQEATASSLASPSRIGEERYLVSLFVDMRGSTRLAEKRLPFDTVFIVNRFLGAVSQAVLSCGGQPNQFVGDGQLALFGLAVDPRTACRQALRAAAQIAANVDDLNRLLVHDLREPIRFGIGIHAGEVIIGDIGYRDHMVFTALGDAVNVAARLQDMTKTLACEAVISEEVATTAQLSMDDWPRHQVAVRGRAEQLVVHTVSDARTLSSLTAETTKVGS